MIIKTAGVLLLLAAILFLLAEAKNSGPPGKKIGILMYHNIIDCDDPDTLSISEKKFNTDMKWLKKNGYNTILPSELSALEAHHRDLLRKTIMIVFDDGYYSNYSLAFPILKETGMKAAVMLITSQVRDKAPEGDPRVAFLTWNNIKEMSESGFIEFGSHSHNLHNPAQKGCYNPGKGSSNGIQRLRGESKKIFRLRLDSDIKKSISLIHECTGQEVCSFAYPFGAGDVWADKVMKQNGIKVTFLTGNLTADLSHGLYNLKRLSIHEDTDISRILSADADAAKK